MSPLRGFFRKLLLDIKIYIRIHYRYPKMFPGSKVYSVLAPELEKLVTPGMIIRENVTLPRELKKLGRYLFIDKNAWITYCEEIGPFCSIGYGARIGMGKHPQNFISTSPMFYAQRRGWISKDTFKEDGQKTTVIGADVMICVNAMISNGVTIGHGSIVGAGAFVNKDVPPYAIVAGMPAKVIRYRFDQDTIARLLESKWWERTDEEIRAAGDFSDPAKFLERLAKKA